MVSRDCDRSSNQRALLKPKQRTKSNSPERHKEEVHKEISYRTAENGSGKNLFRTVPCSRVLVKVSTNYGQRFSIKNENTTHQCF